MCDVKLLFIEPGVFWELKVKPYSSLSTPPVFESPLQMACREKKFSANQQKQPVDLRAYQHSTINVDPSTSKDVSPPPTPENVITSSESVQKDVDQYSTGNESTGFEVNANIPNNQHVLPLNRMCFVHVTRLSDALLNKWTTKEKHVVALTPEAGSTTDDLIPSNVKIDVTGYNLWIMKKAVHKVCFA